MSKFSTVSIDAEIQAYIDAEAKFFCYAEPEKFLGAAEEPDSEREDRKMGLSINKEKGGDKMPISPEEARRTAFLEASRSAEVKVVPLKFEDKLKLVIKNKRNLIKSHKTIMGIDKIAIRTTGGFINRHKDANEFKIIIEKLYEAI